MDKATRLLSHIRGREEEVEYPDFETMWQQVERQLPDPNTRLKTVSARSGRKWRKYTLLTVAATVLVATPVLASVTNQWDRLLSYRSGLQNALDQGLGQTIEKTVTQGNSKLTVNTALIDENRTVILFTLDTGVGKDKFPGFSKSVLVDAEGKEHGTVSTIRWDETTQKWNGYFESHWVPQEMESEVSFRLDDLHLAKQMYKNIDYSVKTSGDKIHKISVNRDGIQDVKIQAFDQGDKVMVDMFTSYSAEKNNNIVSLKIWKGTTPIKEAGTSKLGTPNESGEINAQHYFNKKDLEQDNLRYTLSYMAEEARPKLDWSIPLSLNKAKMLSATVEKQIDTTFEYAGVTTHFDKMILTPTQIRLQGTEIKTKGYLPFPFQHIALKVDGIQINGSMEYTDRESNEVTYRFEIPRHFKMKSDAVVSFVGKYEVLLKRDVREPIHMKGISETKKSLVTKVGGYDVKWTYYKKDGNLYVQSESDDPTFGGVNQTYIKLNGERTSAKPVSLNFTGDGNNKAVDMYKDYPSDEAEIYIFWYYAEDPQKEVEIELKSASK
ncbi:DUF4179 domain-containing protein [Paenibacillus gansuensis]|uniref:DUF4179 domain-containing protein n=1 Tax=Paenibacillus gansuensis TaxID=306542 RepID=A0ABW5P776_9BACL